MEYFPNWNPRACNLSFHPSTLNNFAWSNIYFLCFIITPSSEATGVQISTIEVAGCQSNRIHRVGVSHLKKTLTMTNTRTNMGSSGWIKHANITHTVYTHKHKNRLVLICVLIRTGQWHEPTRMYQRTKSQFGWVTSVKPGILLHTMSALWKLRYTLLLFCSRFIVSLFCSRCIVSLFCSMYVHSFTVLF